MTCNLGERGNQTRIAFLCSEGCALEKRAEGAFFLDGVTAEFLLDVSTRSDRVRLVKATPAGGGAMITLDASGGIEYANVKSCTVGGNIAPRVWICSLVKALWPPALRCANSLSKQAAVQKEPEKKPEIEATQTAVVTPKPGLREAAAERYDAFHRALAPGAV